MNATKGPEVFRLASSPHKEKALDESGGRWSWAELTSGKGLIYLVLLALAIALVSLGANLYLLSQLRSPERLVASIGRSMEGGRTFHYDVRIPAGTPISADIPVNESFTIRVDTVIPLNTTIRVPFDTPIGRRSISVPIRSNVPLRTQLPIQIRDTFRLRTQIGEEIVVPLEIELDQLMEALQNPNF